MQVVHQFMEKVEKKKKMSNFNVNRPISIYSASKISMELISNVYSKLYNMNLIGLRFFTGMAHGEDPICHILNF